MISSKRADALVAKMQADAEKRAAKREETHPAKMIILPSPETRGVHFETPRTAQGYRPQWYHRVFCVHERPKSLPCKACRRTQKDCDNWALRLVADIAQAQLQDWECT